MAAKKKKNFKKTQSIQVIKVVKPQKQEELKKASLMSQFSAPKFSMPRFSLPEDLGKKALALLTPPHLVCAFFLVFIFCIGLQTVTLNYNDMEAAYYKESKGSVKDCIVAVEEAYVDGFWEKIKFIKLHGFVQRVLDKHEVGNFDVIKDEHGSLHIGPLDTHVVKSPDISPLLALKASLDKQKVPILYVSTSNKEIDGVTQFPTGLVSTTNLNKNTLFKKLEDNGIEVLNMAPKYVADFKDPSTLWFKTDHHWKIQTAFYTFGEILKKLDNAFDVSFPNTAFLTDIANYKQLVYNQSFLGTAGRRVGQYYAGLDDFTFILPNFDTDYTVIDYSRFYETKEEKEWKNMLGRTKKQEEEDDRKKATVRGSFEETIMYQPSLKPNLPSDTNRYSAYLQGDYSERSIRNHKGTGNALIIQDSYGLPLTSFLSLAFKETVVLDLRFFDFSTINRYTDNFDFDVVIFINQLPGAPLS